jgi:hypothetical protein
MRKINTKDAFNVGYRAGFVQGVEAALKEMSTHRNTYNSAHRAVMKLRDCESEHFDDEVAKVKRRS